MISIQKCSLWMVYSILEGSPKMVQLKKIHGQWWILSSQLHLSPITHFKALHSCGLCFTYMECTSSLVCWLRDTIWWWFRLPYQRRISMAQPLLRIPRFSIVLPACCPYNNYMHPHKSTKHDRTAAFSQASWQLKSICVDLPQKPHRKWL